MTLKFTKYYVSTGILDEFGILGKRIIFSTRSVTSLILKEDQFQFALNGELQSVDPILLETLKEKKFLIDSKENEYEQIILENREVNNNSEYLPVTILPSANCQLNCHYCGQIHTSKFADNEVIDKIYDRIKLILDTNSYYHGISVTWYGGEPLLGIKSIKDLSKKLIDLCKGKNINYISDMITNGLSLKTKIYKELVNEYLITDFQITLDGISEVHDKRRITKNGDPTFDTIMSNIVEITSLSNYLKYSIQLRMNIDKTNYQFVIPLINLIKEKKLQNKISIYFAEIVDFGSNSASKHSLQKEFFARQEIEWLFSCYKKGIKINIIPSRVFSCCMVEEKNSEAYDAYGNIYSCWEFPYDEIYSQKKLIGNLFNTSDPFEKDTTLNKWRAIFNSEKIPCKGCLFLPVCGGHCPKSWLENKPPCPMFKFNYKEILLLDFYVKKNKNK